MDAGSWWFESGFDWDVLHDTTDERLSEIVSEAKEETEGVIDISDYVEELREDARTMYQLTGQSCQPNRMSRNSLLTLVEEGAERRGVGAHYRMLRATNSWRHPLDLARYLLAEADDLATAS